ncbi:MAG: hypothetical protein M3Y57_21980 [Acidobacteriota bacterium]|nr:hypothetical protein [Acidobacteriota bacterium]
MSLVFLFSLTDCFDAQSRTEEQQIIALARGFAPTYNVQHFIFDQKLVGSRGSNPSKEWHPEWAGYSTRLNPNGRMYGPSVRSDGTALGESQRRSTLSGTTRTRLINYVGAADWKGGMLKWRKLLLKEWS